MYYRKERSIRVMPVLNHIHSFRRRPGKHKAGTMFSQYMCVHPDCSCVMPAELLVGKRVACVCGRTFIIECKGAGRNFFQYATLKCEKCSSSERARKKQAAADIMSDAILSETALPKPLPFVEIKSPIDIEETVLKLPEPENHDVMLPFHETDDSLFDEDD